MYRILVVDDEPIGLNHVRMILEKKCPQFEIIGTAENGAEALELIRRDQPDILITDIRMPIMDGIALVSQVKKEFPEILSVIVSGYSEFEYAKSALRSGVCDYLLKPLVPSDMMALMERMEIRLNSLYHEKRTQILRSLCHKEVVDDETKMKQYFSSEAYYAVIFRWNGLPSRFIKKHGVEIFSMEEEKIYIYGRDEMEALYLIPREIVFQSTFPEFLEKLFRREQKQNRGSYVTGVFCEVEISIGQLADVAERLYRKLDESLIIGKNQLTGLESDIPAVHVSEAEKRILENVEQLIRCCQYQQISEELHNIFSVWKMEERSQLYMESEIKYILRLLQNACPLEMKSAEIEYMLDDVFYYAADMEELENSLVLLMKQCIPNVRKERIDDKEQLFRSILAYLNTHIKEPLTLGDICRKFGVSQTSLSRIFRAYKETSFTNYLTEMRMDQAKRIMQQEPSAYVKDIAERVGYLDQFYFSRIFRSVTGVCPKEYMERAM